VSYCNTTNTEGLPSVETHATDIEGYFSPSSTRPLWGSTNSSFFVSKGFHPSKTKSLHTCRRSTTVLQWVCLQSALTKNVEQQKMSGFKNALKMSMLQ